MSAAALMDCGCIVLDARGCAVPGRNGKAQRRPTEEVVDGSGRAIAIRCTGCTKIIAMLGVCPGCGRPACQLPYVVETGTEKNYYHAEDCGIAHAKKLSTARGARVKAFKAAQTKIPGVE